MNLFKFLVGMATSILALAPSTEAAALLILNMSNEEILPRNFRTCRTPITADTSIPSLEGLFDLRISGSAQFSANSWKTLIEATQHQGLIFDVDLRQETHGFVNGSAISLYFPRDWGNVGKSDQTIREEEALWLKSLAKEKSLEVKVVQKKEGGIIEKASSLNFKDPQIASEQEIVKETCSGYLRLYVPDHLPPAPEDVDTFISFARNLPVGTWVHFHCAAGNGRTTTFMAIFDMIHNAKRVKLEDIILRQELLGGANLFKQYPPLHWKYPFAKGRELFLRKFYQYALTNEDGFKTSWSCYLKEKIGLMTDTTSPLLRE